MQLFCANLVVILTSMAITLTGCAVQPQKPPMTPLEIQSLQTREYESPKKIVFASVVSVFQDLGYTIKGADLKTGFINAESATQHDAALQILLGLSQMEQTAATAFIEEIGDRTRVRLNFVTTRQSSSAYGQSSRRDIPILDVKIYTNAFERIENAIFIRSGN